MKNRISTILTVILVAALVLGAVCIGGVKGYKEEREELLLACMEMHASAGTNLSASIEECEEDAADFDARLKHKWMGKIAASFGVEPLKGSVEALHAQLSPEQSAEVKSTDFLQQLRNQVGELLENTIDFRLSIMKTFVTFVFAALIFVNGSFLLGKVLAGIGLYKLLKKK